jgi:hypothetical protein
VFDIEHSSSANKMPNQPDREYGANDGPLGKAAEFSVGASDSLLLIVSGFGFLFLAWTVYWIIITKVKSARELQAEWGGQELGYDAQLAHADVLTLNRAQRRARARHIMKQQRRMGPPGAATVHDVAAGEEGVDIDNDNRPQMRMIDAEQQQQQQVAPPEDAIPHFQDDTYHQGSLRHLSRKDRQKAAKLVEREERRLLEEVRRKEQIEAQESAQQKRRARERLLTLQVEEDRKGRKAQRDAEEWKRFQAWRIFLSSDPSGAAPTHQSLSVKDWIDELKHQRVTSLKGLSDRFQVSLDQVIERVDELLDSGRVTGILDGENNRFIYISAQSELPILASFIKSQNVVSSEDVRNRIQELVVS